MKTYLKTLSVAIIVMATLIYGCGPSHKTDPVDTKAELKIYNDSVKKEISKLYDEWQNAEGYRKQNIEFDIQNKYQEFDALEFMGDDLFVMKWFQDIRGY